jgi:hypothetical protein
MDMLGWIHLNVLAWMDFLGRLGLDGLAWMDLLGWFHLDEVLGWICLDGLAWMDLLGWIGLDEFACYVAQYYFSFFLSNCLFVLRWAYTGCVLEPYHFSSSCKTRSIGVMGLFSFSCFSASCWLVCSAARLAVPSM